MGVLWIPANRRILSTPKQWSLQEAELSGSKSNRNFSTPWEICSTAESLVASPRVFTEGFLQVGEEEIVGPSLPICCVGDLTHLHLTHKVVVKLNVNIRVALGIGTLLFSCLAIYAK